MKELNLIRGIAISFLIFVMALLLGCAMDTQNSAQKVGEKPDPMSFMPLVPPQDLQTRAEEPHQPAEPTHTAQPAPSTTPSQAAKPGQDLDIVSSPTAKDETIKVPAVLSPLPQIDTPHIGLHIDPDKIQHKITISLVSDEERFGEVEEIEVDMTQHAYYSAVILMPKDAVAKLNIMRRTESQTQNYDYELTRVHHGINGDIIVQSDNDTKLNQRDFGDTHVVRIRDQKTGDLKIIEKPLYRKVEGEHPVFVVKKIDNHWSAQFETEITKALYQMREEGKIKDQKGMITETQFVEFHDGVNFATMRQELFSSMLALPEVQKALRELGIEVSVDDVISINSYITIDASDQPIDLTKESR